MTKSINMTRIKPFPQRQRWKAKWESYQIEKLQCRTLINHVLELAVSSGPHEWFICAVHAHTHPSYTGTGAPFIKYLLGVKRHFKIEQSLYTSVLWHTGHIPLLASGTKTPKGKTWGTFSTTYIVTRFSEIHCDKKLNICTFILVE